jgi:hypothetical protein
MASIYRRGNVLWAMLTGGVRRSLGTRNKAEARSKVASAGGADVAVGVGASGESRREARNLG